jgi:PPP family 3-phenylpropionic acid transporter
MGLPLAGRLGTPAARTGAYYSTLLMSVAVATPFLPIWLADKGMSSSEIGFVNAAPIFVMVVISLIVGRVADRAKDWRTVIVIGSVLAAIPPFLLLGLDGFWPILVVWTLLNLPFHAIVPVVDAATMRMSIRTGSDFGRIRVWGTLGFVTATLIAGFLLETAGVVAFVPLLIVVSLMRAGLSLQLPLFRDQSGVAPPKSTNPLVAGRSRELWRPWFVLALIGGSLLHGSQMMVAIFGALLWTEQGIAGWQIGVLFAIAPASEILALVYYKQFSRVFAARQLMLIGCAAGVLRWCIFALEPGFEVLALMQLLHLMTTGFLIMGMTSFIANWTTEDIAAEAQSFFVVIRQVVMVAAILGFGAIAGTMGSDAYYIAAIVSALAGAMIVASLRLMSPKTEARHLA